MLDDIVVSSLDLSSHDRKCFLFDLRPLIYPNLQMTQIVLPIMLKKRQGYIINIGSSAGSSPTPFLTLYSACKVRNHRFFKNFFHIFIYNLLNRRVYNKFLVESQTKEKKIICSFWIFILSESFSRKFF